MRETKDEACSHIVIDKSSKVDSAKNSHFSRGTPHNDRIIPTVCSLKARTQRVSILTVQINSRLNAQEKFFLDEKIVSMILPI